jgi:hypothetical protein
MPSGIDATGGQRWIGPGRGAATELREDISPPTLDEVTPLFEGRIEGSVRRSNHHLPTIDLADDEGLLPDVIEELKESGSIVSLGRRVQIQSIRENHVGSEHRNGRSIRDEDRGGIEGRIDAPRDEVRHSRVGMEVDPEVVARSLITVEMTHEVLESPEFVEAIEIDQGRESCDELRVRKSQCSGEGLKVGLRQIARIGLVLEGVEPLGSKITQRSLVEIATRPIDMTRQEGALDGLHMGVQAQVLTVDSHVSEGTTRSGDTGPTKEFVAQALIHLREIDPALAPEAVLHASPAPLLESYGLHEDIEKALKARVWLKSGGYIVIEETEALVSIDVNTGKFLGGTELEQTALRTNLEAAVEIGRQLRLRDLGGIIVIDFIDMASEESRRQTLEALQQVLAADSAKTKIVGLSDLGLMQLTRKRTRPSLKALTTAPCSLCRGRGRVRKD